MPHQMCNCKHYYVKQGTKSPEHNVYLVPWQTQHANPLPEKKIYKLSTIIVTIANMQMLPSIYSKTKFDEV